MRRRSTRAKSALLLPWMLLATSCSCGETSTSAASTATTAQRPGSTQPAPSDEAPTTDSSQPTSSDDPKRLEDELVQDRDNLSSGQRAAIDELTPSSDCADTPASSRAEPGSDEVEIEIISIVDGCMVFEYRATPLGSVDEVLDQLDNDPAVLGASPMLLEALPDRDEQVDQWSSEQIGLSDPRPTGDGITVAIIDTGIDDSHPDLQGKVRDRYQPGPGPLAITNDHGTHVAGIVAAEPNNDEGIVGIAPGVELLDAPALAAASAPSVSDSVRWATDSGADVVNMSIALVITMKRSLWDKITFTQSVGSLTETFELALYYASSNGVILVGSAGNCGDGRGKVCEGIRDRPQMPALHPDVITVAATDRDDTRAVFSTKSRGVDIAAPGVDIVSDKIGGGTETYSGTSQATPQVVGTIASLAAEDGPYPGNPGEAAERLLDTTFDLGESGRDDEYGEGRLDFEAALDGLDWSRPLSEATPSIPDGPVVERLDDTSFRIRFEHPTWGPSVMETTESESNGPASIVVFDRATGSEQWRYDNEGMYELKPTGYSEYVEQSDVVIDETGNIFIIFEPGRLYGVIALRPIDGGFEDFESLPPSDGYQGRWYSARVDDLDHDGVNEIVTSLNNCDPSCAGPNSYTEVTSTWDGSGFVDGDEVELPLPTSFSD